MSHHQSVLKASGSFGLGTAAEKPDDPVTCWLTLSEALKPLSLEAYIRSVVVKAIRACCPSEDAIPSSLIISQVKLTGQAFSACNLPIQGSQLGQGRLGCSCTSGVG